MSERKWKPWRQWEWDIYGFRCSLSSVAILHFHSYPTTSTVIPSASSTNPNMHFKVSKHGSLLNHNRHFAAHSLFIASINMEKPCLNSPVIGSPLMLTVIMVILVPGITRCPHLSFTTPKNTHRWSYARWNRKWEKNSCHTSTMGAVFWGNKSLWAFTEQTMGLKAIRQQKWGLTYSSLFIPSYWQEKQTSHVPQIYFATNSSRKLFLTAATNSLWKKLSSLKTTQNKKLEGDWLKRCQSLSELNMPCPVYRYDTNCSSLREVTITTNLITEHLCARLRMLSTC